MAARRPAPPLRRRRCRLDGRRRRRGSLRCSPSCRRHHGAEAVALQPKLKQATIDTDALLDKIAVDTKEANKVEAVVSAERKQCNEQAAEASEIATSCQADLDKAMPALEGAIAALKKTEKRASSHRSDGV